ncbi:hypothetical protein ABIG06_007131 [Bradyrhizobium sp. USDA 326]
MAFNEPASKDPQNDPWGRRQDSYQNALWSYLCGEFVKHPEKAKNGQLSTACPAILSHPTGNLRDWP